MFSELIEEVTDWSVLTESVGRYVAGLSFHSVIVTIMMVFLALGAVDKAQGNKRGYGAAFDKGFEAMGPLAIAMVGVIAAAPVLSMVLRPIIAPVYEMLGSSPSVFATTLLLADAGGYSLAVELAGQDVVMGQFAGLVIGCTMGCILLGCLVGGLVMNLSTGYHMDLVTMLFSLLPVILVAGVLAAGLWFKPIALMNGFSRFGAFVTGLIAIFVAIAVVQEKTGLRLPLFHLMVDAGADGVSPLANSIEILGDIAFILLGAFPMVEWIKRRFGGALAKLGGKLGMDKTASAGIIATLANNIPTFGMVKDMNPKGKLLNIAFASCAAFMFGDHLGFVAGVNAEMIVPMIFAKLACGLSALFLANLLAPQLLAKAESARQESGTVPAKAG